MYKIETNLKERYIILTFKDHTSYQEYVEITQKMVEASKQFKEKFGVVTDMREWKSSDGNFKELASDAMQKTIQLGMALPVARVINNVMLEPLKEWQEAGAKAGLTSRYFSDMESAIKFVKELVSK